MSMTTKQKDKEVKKFLKQNALFNLSEIEKYEIIERLFELASTKK